jgi:hypothetical protein
VHDYVPQPRLPPRFPLDLPLSRFCCPLLLSQYKPSLSFAPRHLSQACLDLQSAFRNLDMQSPAREDVFERTPRKKCARSMECGPRLERAYDRLGKRVQGQRGRVRERLTQ